MKRLPSVIIVLWFFVMTASSAAADRSAAPAKSRRDADKLISTLVNSGAARVRAQAALALSSFDGDPSVVAALMRALGDSHVMVRSSAARALTSVAPHERFAELCERGMAETEPFARTWIQKAAARSAGRSPRVLVNVDGLECVSGENQGNTSQKLRSAFLEKLFVYDGYSIGMSLDFSDRGADTKKTEIELTLVGDLVTTGSKQAATAKLDLRAVAPGGFVVWAVVIEVLDAVQGKAPEINDPFADEYTIREEGEDARFVAAGEAGRRAAARLNVELRGFE